MKIYIAGPMRGIPEYNFPEFNRVAQKLREAGHIALNPAEKESEASAHTWEYWMREDIRMILDADALVVLEGWRTSRGATFEVYVARQLNMPVFDENMNGVDTEQPQFKKDPLVIGICGKKQSGKTTAAQIIQSHFGKTEIVSFADPLKAECAKALGLTDSEHSKLCLEKERIRPLWQWWGTEYRREHFGKSYWINQMHRRFQESQANIFVIPDVRFPNEAFFIKSLEGHVIRIHRPDCNGDAHASESGMDHFGEDFVVGNEGSVKDLREQIVQIMKKLLPKN